MAVAALLDRVRAVDQLEQQVDRFPQLRRRIRQQGRFVLALVLDERVHQPQRVADPDEFVLLNERDQANQCAAEQVIRNRYRILADQLHAQARRLHDDRIFVGGQLQKHFQNVLDYLETKRFVFGFDVGLEGRGNAYSVYVQRGHVLEVDAVELVQNQIDSLSVPAQVRRDIITNIDERFYRFDEGFVAHFSLTLSCFVSIRIQL